MCPVEVCSDTIGSLVFVIAFLWELMFLPFVIAAPLIPFLIVIDRIWGLPE